MARRLLLGDLVAKRRQDLGWSIRELADAAGVGIATVWRLESTNRIQHLDTLTAIAGALGTTAGKLLTEVDESVSPPRKNAKRASART